MNRDDYQHLLAEREQLCRILENIPEDDVIDRMSVQARLEKVETTLTKNQLVQREPARVKLTFRGKPVVGTYGIFADFGASAVSKFIDAVAGVAASFSAPLAASGPIPNRVKNQLLITSTAVGSFGFELEEHLEAQLPLVDGPTEVGLALEQTQALLQGTLGSDDELADTAADVDPRAIGLVRSFLEILTTNDATCSLESGGRSFRFSDLGQVRRSFERLSQDNLQEQSQVLEGEFQGVLPKRRIFEFILAGQTEIITGKVGPVIQDAALLNSLLGQPVRVKVMTTSVGNGRPRYLLLEEPETTLKPE